MLSIGFTGTRQGMTAHQSATLERKLREKIEATPFLENTVRFHHGDCIGADAEFDRMLRLIFTRPRIILHPSYLSHLRAHCETNGEHSILPLYQPLVRNRHIVQASEILFAAPSTKHEVLRSGTWATIRYARKVGCAVELIEP